MAGGTYAYSTTDKWPAQYAASTGSPESWTIDFTAPVDLYIYEEASRDAGLTDQLSADGWEQLSTSLARTDTNDGSEDAYRLWKKHYASSGSVTYDLTDLLQGGVSSGTTCDTTTMTSTSTSTFSTTSTATTSSSTVSTTATATSTATTSSSTVSTTSSATTTVSTTTDTNTTTMTTSTFTTSTFTTSTITTSTLSTTTGTTSTSTLTPSTTTTILTATATSSTSTVTTRTTTSTSTLAAVETTTTTAAGSGGTTSTTSSSTQTRSRSGNRKRFRGDLVLQLPSVSQASDIVAQWQANPSTVGGAIKESIATTLGILARAVIVHGLRRQGGRRLGGSARRQLQSSTAVVVDYTVELPEEDAADANITAASITAMSSDLPQVLNTALANAGVSVVVQSVVVSTPSVTLIPANAAEEDAEESSTPIWVIIAAVAVGAVVCLAAMGGLLFMMCRQSPEDKTEVVDLRPSEQADDLQATGVLPEEPAQDKNGKSTGPKAPVMEPNSLPGQEAEAAMPNAVAQALD